MWELNNSNAYQTNEFCVTGEDYYSISPQWDVDNGYSSYSENERDLATVLMNLKEDCKSHSNNSHEEYVHNYYNYQTNNFSSDSNLHHQHHHNNPHDQHQHQHHQQQPSTWHTPITTAYAPNEPAQRVPVYNPSMDCGYYQPTDDCNYNLLPTILDIDEEFCKVNVSSDEKKRVGRPRGTKSKRSKSEPKLSRIWEFIRDLLLDAQYCPTYICWENYEEGRFRFVQSDKVAKLWGKFKRNERMNYEKFSRAMRYYYKTGVLLPVQGKRLVYKFGPKATGWHTDNPNFKYAY